MFSQRFSLSDAGKNVILNPPFLLMGAAENELGNRIHGSEDERNHLLSDRETGGVCSPDDVPISRSKGDRAEYRTAQYERFFIAGKTAILPLRIPFPPRAISMLAFIRSKWGVLPFLEKLNPSIAALFEVNLVCTEAPLFYGALPSDEER